MPNEEPIEAPATEGFEDEKLDDLLGDEPAPVEKPTPTQPSEEPTGDAPTTEELETEDDEDEDDLPVDETSDDPKDIAIRNLRHKNRRLKKKLDKQPKAPAPVEEPTTVPAKGTPLYSRFVQNEFRTNVLYAKQQDPTVIERLPVIKKIMFQEMPELLEKPDGFTIANDLAKGRTISVTVPAEKGAELQPQTSPARPRQPKTAPKQLSQTEYDKMSPEQQVAYENSQIGV